MIEPGVSMRMHYLKKMIYSYLMYKIFQTTNTCSVYYNHDKYYNDNKNTIYDIYTFKNRVFLFISKPSISNMNAINMQR